MNGFYRGRGGLKAMTVVVVIVGVLYGAAYVMHLVSSDWAYIPAIVLGSAVVLAVLLFKLLGPLS